MKKIIAILIIIPVLFLSGCKYKVDVDLTAEERQTIKAEIETLKEDIIELDNSPEGYDILKRIELAKAYERLGDVGKAIKVYKSYLDSDRKSLSTINNLGHLYERAGEYDLAIEQYQRLVDEYNEKNYLYDIVWAHIRAKNRKEAEKVFNEWQLIFNRTDDKTVQALKRLREEEGIE